MTEIRRTAFTPFSAAQMYRLVNDVEAYPEFLPWCADARVLAHDVHLMRAQLTIKKGPLDYAFSTENRLQPDRAIEISLIDGPFSALHGLWQFDNTDGGCVVKLALEFEFAGRVLGAVLSTAFKPLADSLVDAFRTRAHAVYGRQSA